jgi:hypothetical protein
MKKLHFQYKHAHLVLSMLHVTCSSRHPTGTMTKTLSIVDGECLRDEQGKAFGCLLTSYLFLRRHIPQRPPRSLVPFRRICSSTLS